MRRIRRAAESPRGETGDRSTEDENADERAQHTAARTALRRKCFGHDLFLVAMRNAGVVLVDVQVPVQAEELRIRPQEALRVRLAGEHVPALLLEGCEIPLPNPDPVMDIRSTE